MKLSDLEDDIELPTGDVDEAEVPRRLSRLKKAKILNLPEESEGVDTPESDGRSIASKGAVLAHAADDDHANEDVSIHLSNYFKSASKEIIVFEKSLLLFAGRQW